MMMKFMQVALVLAGGLALAGCQPPKAVAPVKKPAAADYALVVPPGAAPANLKAICYNDADIGTIRARMFHQEMVVAVLQCQTPTGGRAFEAMYSTYLGKFGGDLSSNARALTELSRRKRFNIDTVVTEFSNRTAQRAPVDKEYCARNLRALEWALDPKVTTLTQAPPPYDLGQDMNMLPCAAP